MIKIRFSFIVTALAMVLLGFGRVFIVLLVSVTLHELAHVLTARKFGARVEGINFTALGEAAVLRRMEFMCGWQRLVTLLSGPALNLLIGLAAGVHYAAAPGFPFADVVYTAGKYNILLFVLNMTPVFPLDGGRIAQLILGGMIGVPRANKIIVRLGSIIGVPLIALGFAYAVLYTCNISLICVGLYIIRVNRRIMLPLAFEFFQSMINKAEQIKSKGALPVRMLYADGAFPLQRALERLTTDHMTLFLLEGDNHAAFSETELINHIMKNGFNGTVGNLLDA